MAQQIEPGDRIVFYVTGLQAFGGSVRVTGELYEDRTRLWPGKPGNPDPYPWRFATEPEVVLDEHDFVPAEDVALELEHVRKWPAQHWQLAFQGAAAQRVRRRRRPARAAPARGGSGGGVSDERAQRDRIRTLLLRGDNLLRSGRPERLPRALVQRRLETARALGD